MKHIVIVINRFGGGGAETQAKRISIELTSRGYRVSCISLLEDVYGFQELDVSGIQRFELKASRGWRSFLALPKLTRLLKSLKPDLAIGLMIPADPILRVAGAATNIPIVSSLRNQYLGGRLVNLFLRLTDRYVSVLTTNTNVVKETLGPHVTSSPSSIMVVPNGLPIENYKINDLERTTVRAELGVADEFLWLSIGSQRPQKNYKELIKAFAPIKGARLAIAGTNLQEKELNHLRDDLKIEDRLILLGRRSDIPSLLAAADGYVMASLHEGLPNAVMEAMAAGKPVVATRVGGVPDLIVDGVTGLLVSPADSGGLTRSMEAVMKLSPEERYEMGSCARLKVAASYSVQASVDQWEKVFLKIFDREL